MKKALSVLVVRGSEDDLARAFRELERAGFNPSTMAVQTEGAFLHALQGGTWDIVLVYSAPPHTSIREVVRRLAERETDVPVIAVTANVGDESVVAAMKAGAHDCIFRGDLTRLPSVVERELAEAGVRQSARHDNRRRREAEERYRSLIDEIPALTYLASADDVGSRLYVSPQITAMTGFTPGEWLADRESWSRQIHPDDRDRVLGEYRRCVVTGEPFVCEYRMLTREGQVTWWRDEGHFLPDGGRRGYLRGLVVDVTERKEAQEALRRMAYRDALTELPNRSMLQERLHAALRPGQRPIAMLIVDLDRFREVNNTLGYQNGDIVLREVAHRLTEVVGDPEHAARLRGDEFGVLLPDADLTLANQVAGKILKVMQQPIMVERLPIEVGASIGIALAPEHATDAEILLRRADLAMQAAKTQGSGAVVYSSACDPYNPLGLVLLSELRRALESDQLLLHYQPKVDLRSSSVVGAEALVRWQHPRRGLVPPQQFIGLAEQGGLIKAITRWVLDNATTQCRSWDREGTRLQVSVNISARNLTDPNLVSEVREILQQKELAPELLELEITESAVMADAARATETLRQLQRQGVDLSLDDFGTGYSSLVFLTKLPVSEIKIDKSFVLGATHNDEDAIIVRSTNDLGHNLGLKVVAEGVEDERTLELLNSYGCDAAQGFFMAPPMTAANLGQWLRTSPWGMAH